MAVALTLVEISEAGERELAQIVPNEDQLAIILGREANPDDGGLRIDRPGVSRQHGSLTPFGSCWVFRDLGSTNGSWVNDLKLQAEQGVVVRPGDTIQMADTFVRLLPAAGAGAGEINQGRSVLVFSRGEFAGEYVIPQYGRVVSFGGSRSEFTIDGDAEELPSLVVEGRGEQVVAFSVAPVVKFAINGVPGGTPSVIHDRNTVSIGQHQILFSIPVVRPLLSSQPQGTGSRASGVANWEHVAAERQQKASKSPFGQKLEDNGHLETVALTPQELKSRVAGFDMHPAMRGALMEEEPAPLGGIEDRVIIFIGGFLVLSVLILIIVWLFV